MQISIDLTGYWHPGTGRGSGSHLDAVILRDRFGLPFIPGKHLKGLFRDAVFRLEQWGQLQQFSSVKEHNWTTWLFGTESFSTPAGQHTTGIARDFTEPGHLRFNNACLPQDLHDWLAYPNHKAERACLFRDIYSTAIDAKTGVAKKSSLRGMEVVVPMTLISDIHCPGDDAGLPWREVLEYSLPLIRSVGGHRTRGFGRACISRYTEQEA